jgi:hypothetical protein
VEDEGQKGGAHRWGAPLIAARGGGRGRQNQWAAKPWSDKAVATVQTWSAWEASSFGPGG